MNKIISQICSIQEVKNKKNIRCPYCEETRIKIKNNKWSCYCGKHGDIFELLRLVEEDYLHKHPLFFWNCKSNKGVGY